MRIKDLEKQLYKEYWEHDQQLWIASMEVLRYRSPNSGPFCIYTVNPKTEKFSTFLFEVQNYNAFHEEIELAPKSILYPDKFEYKWRFDSAKASSSVFYNDKERLYTIPKFTDITEEDILRCFKHFKRTSLDFCLIFNIKWYDFKDNVVDKS